MSNIVPESVKNAFKGKAGAKHQQMASDTVEPTKDDRLTTDAGTRISNTDDWLRVNGGDRTGPMLLEDQVGREKVFTRPLLHLNLNA